MKYIGKKLLFALNFEFKKSELVKFWKIDKWYSYEYCLYFSKKKMGGGGHRWNIEEGLSQTLKMCQRDEVWSKMFRK